MDIAGGVRVATAASDAVPMHADQEDPAALAQFLISPDSVNGHVGARLAVFASSLGTHTVTSILGGGALVVAISTLTLSARATTAVNDSSPTNGSSDHTLEDLSTTRRTPLARFGSYALVGQLVSSVALITAIVMHAAAGIVGRLELTSEAGVLLLLAISTTRNPRHLWSSRAKSDTNARAMQ